MKRLRFAIIGCGRIAHRHAVQAKRVGELVSVCDVSESKAILFANQYQAKPFATTEELHAAGGFDIAVICTPNGWHARQAIEALQHSCHVLVEKPMAISSDDCREMIAAASGSSRKLFTVMQNRYNPPVLAVKKALEKQAFGKISSVQLTCFWNRDDDYFKDAWRGTEQWDGGTLFTQFSHFIDLLCWFFGNINYVQAITRNANHPGIAFEDCGAVLIGFENGIIGTINFSINSFARNREGSLAILGDNGIVKIGGEYLNTIEYQQFAAYELELASDMRPANDYGTYMGSMSNHDKVYDNLAGVLLGQETMYATPAEGLKTVEIIEQIYRAARR